MNNRKLDLISRLDDDIIERNSQKRYLLSSRPPKRHFSRRLAIILVAATLLFALLTGSLIFLFFGEKTVPVYTGMTVSSQYSGIESADISGLWGIRSLSLVPLAEGNNGNHNGQVNKPDNGKIENAIRDELKQDDSQASDTQPSQNDSSLTVGDNSELYYANANEDIYITIHFDNPDDFEILSFTFNGKKYTSYMFEEGSDMENIVIKQNIGDTAGLVQYTIDAIKYVDGTEIKDVKMEGDQTVSVGVYSDELQPLPSVTDEVINFNDISFNITVTDSFELVKQSEGKLYAMLYNGEEIVASQELTVGEAVAVKFEGLTTGSPYQYTIVGVYDSYDKQGVVPHVLYTKEFSTKTILSFTDANTDTESISFSLLWDEAFDNKVISSLSLYKGEEKICDISSEQLSVGGLLSNCEYTLVAEYINNGALEKVEYKIKTKAKSVPTLSVAVTEDITSVDFDISITDTDKIGNISKIELIRDDGDTKATENADIRSFTDLEKLRSYTIKITYTYDLNDGKGKQSFTDSFDFVTQSAGLDVSGGKLEGLGTFNGTELYINAPISDPSCFLSSGSSNTTIKSLHLGPGVGKVYSGPFQNLKALTHVTLYDGITEIDSHAFSECANLTGIILPNTITEIKSYTFFNCFKLESIIIPEGVKSIGESAFCQCYELTTAVIPKSVNEIGASAFNNCEKLEIANIPEGIVIINPWAFANCNLQTIVIPNSVTKIDEAAFAGNDIRSITIPSSVTYIGKLAFSSCLLESISIPDSVTYIGEEAFSNCYYLKSVTLPSTVTTIASQTFYDSGLESIIIPNGVTSIQDKAFYSCDELESITIPTGLISISEDAFIDCGMNAFNIYISDLKAWLNGKIIIKPRADVNIYLNNAPLTEIVMPSDVNNIRDYAFYNCTGITSITIPEGVTSIGQYAFYNCQSLDSVTVPTSVTSIGGYAFAECELLESVTVLGDVSLINEYTFNNCQSLKEVYLPQSVTRIRANSFTNCPHLTKVHFDGTKSQWNAIVLVDGWKNSSFTVKCSDGDIIV